MRGDLGSGITVLELHDRKEATSLAVVKQTLLGSQCVRLQGIILMENENSCGEWLKVWKRRGIRAPHKPLLMLVALRAALEDGDRLLPFHQWDQRLRPLLRKYTTSKSLHTEYPFWRLQKDGIWEVPDVNALIRRRSNDDPLKSELIKKSIQGGFTANMFHALTEDVAFRSEFITAMLRYFPELVHKELLRDLNLL